MARPWPASKVKGLSLPAYVYIGVIVSIDPFIKTHRAIIKEEIMSVRTIIIIDDNIAGYV